MRNPAKLFKLWIGFVPLICTSEPEMVQRLLTHPQCLEKPYLYDLFKMKFGLFAAHYNIWKGQRKALNPSFNQKILNEFVPIFDKCAQNLVKNLLQNPEGDPVQVTHYMKLCTLEMVCATTIGSDINKDPNTFKLAHLITTILEYVSRRFLNIFLHAEFIYRLKTDYKEEESMREEAYKYADEIFQDTLKRRAKQSEIVVSSNRDDYRKPQIFIDQMLNLHDEKVLSDIEVIQNVYTMIAAGSDTSGIEMGIIAQLLAMYPHLQEKVYQEIREVFPAGAELHFTTENLRQLRYMEMFIKESLRLFPVGPNIGRKTMGDIELDGMVVPSGTLLAISIYNLHRRKDVWGPKAEEFNPENFAPERSEGRHPFAYLPFSGGNRNCIGNRYAMISIKIMMVHLLKNFQFETVEPVLPFFGNGLDFFQKNAVEIWESLSRPFFDDKRIFKLNFGPIVILCINHPDLFQKVIMESASMEKPYVYNFLRVERGLLLGQFTK
ncbi:cytochrome P450 4c21-like [Sabethes cyaneus]|uniref:cytochrome P450 4c21-like n=1 Tax=Sabethes cyaneus TaxID=53552 RepID=UPI00237E0B39|nr:cytochrome P450 4c21-like [Sabethes cyaneus]